MSYNQRLKRLQDLLKEKQVDAALIEDTQTLFYLSGQKLSAGRLLIFQEDARLIIDARYFETCKENSPIPCVLLSKQAFLQCLEEGPAIESLAFDPDLLSYGAFQRLEKELSSLTKEGKNAPRLVAISRLCGQLRKVKDFAEQQALKAAAQLGSQGFDFVCSLLKEGISEIEVVLELEIFWRRKGGQKLAFDPIIAFGANSSMPHYHPGEHTLKPGQAVLIDIGVTYLDYNSDMTRVVFFGEPDPKLKEIYGIVQRAQSKALSQCRPGVSIGALDHSARDLIEEAGYGEAFSHSLGHGIGLDVHEWPRISHKHPDDKDKVLEPGMAITIEPGIYLPGLGGVRIEDTVLITEDGHENLTQRSTELCRRD